MNVKNALKRIVKTGEIKHGTNETLKALEEDKADIVITAENTPEDIEQRIKEKANQANTPHRKYPGTGLELGETCKRTHLVTAIAVKDTGKVNIQEIEGE